MKSKNKATTSTPSTEEAFETLPETLAFFEKYRGSVHGFCIVLEKFQVTPMLFHLVGTTLENGNRNLIKGEIYTAQELVGDQHWLPFDGWWRHDIVLCIRHFATFPNFNLRFNEHGVFEYLGYQLKR